MVADDSPHGSLSAETLRLPGKGPAKDVVVDTRDSQVGSWWGKAYPALNEIERMQKQQVPMQQLYDMYLAKDVFPGYEGTFQVSDFEHLVLIWLRYHENRLGDVTMQPVRYTMGIPIHHQHHPT